METDWRDEAWMFYDKIVLSEVQAMLDELYPELEVVATYEYEPLESLRTR